MKLSKSYRKAIAKIKDKGFSHIKIELEAELDRGSGERESECMDCSDGFRQCDECGGDGYFIDQEEVELECLYCHGEGNVGCGSCGERGYRESAWDLEDCDNYIKNRLTPDVCKAFTFFEVYDDGSVDTEATFTLPIEKAHYAIDVIKAFKSLGEQVGNGIDVSAAGMHISIMPDGEYPCSTELHPLYMENFRHEVTKLLPALFFTASHNQYTRRFEYRAPQVSDHDKYSAVYTGSDRFIEYRLFDTCYDQPKALFDKIEVIAGTLDFYSNQKVTVKYKELAFKDVRDLTKEFGELEAYEALHQTIKYVKPGSKSVKRLKHERGLVVTKKTLIERMREVMKGNKAEYGKYLAGWEDYNNQQVHNFIHENRRWANMGRNIQLPADLLLKGEVKPIKKWMCENNMIDKKPMSFKDWYNANQPYHRSAYTLQLN